MLLRARMQTFVTKYHDTSTTHFFHFSLATTPALFIRFIRQRRPLIYSAAPLLENQRAWTRCENMDTSSVGFRAMSVKKSLYELGGAFV